MNVKIFNVSLVAGWLFAMIGGMLMNIGAGMAFGGLLLIALVFLSAKIAGGVYVPEASDGVAREVPFASTMANMVQQEQAAPLSDIL